MVVEYEDLEGKAVVSMEDPIKAKSFWADMIHEMQCGGNVTKILQKTEVDRKKLVVVEGLMRSGGEEHFYLEPNTTLTVPLESAMNLTVYTSTQAVTKQGLGWSNIEEVIYSNDDHMWIKPRA